MRGKIDYSINDPKNYLKVNEVYKETYEEALKIHNQKRMSK